MVNWSILNSIFTIPNSTFTLDMYGLSFRGECGLFEGF